MVGGSHWAMSTQPWGVAMAVEDGHGWGEPLGHVHSAMGCGYGSGGWSWLGGSHWAMSPQPWGVAMAVEDCHGWGESLGHVHPAMGCGYGSGGWSWLGGKPLGHVPSAMGCGYGSGGWSWLGREAIGPCPLCHGVWLWQWRMVMVRGSQWGVAMAVEMVMVGGGKPLGHVPSVMGCGYGSGGWSLLGGAVCSCPLFSLMF